MFLKKRIFYSPQFINGRRSETSTKLLHLQYTVETNADAVMRVQMIESYKDWKEDRVSYMATARYFKGFQRYVLGFETFMPLLFYTFGIIGIVFGILNLLLLG